MKKVIHWFRRDLRLTDNTALREAMEKAECVIPVFIQSEWKDHHSWTGARRQEFLCGSLLSLAKNIEEFGGKLIVRRGDAGTELEKLLRETRAEALFFNRDPDPFGRAMEKKIHALAKSIGVTVFEFKDAAIHERDEVLTGSGGSYRVFTPYANAWGRLPKISPKGISKSFSVSGKIQNLPLPTLGDWNLSPSGALLPEPGERAARKRLSEFLKKRISEYAVSRNTPDRDASRISQDLRFGLLSIREVFTQCKKHAESAPAGSRDSIQKYISELIWREFYMQILWHYPEVLKHEFNPKFRGMKWPGKSENFTCWKNVETGFPIVDAAMRQLHETGYMHNRARMIVAMFLTKDLHLDWRLGEQYFMQMLVDGEIASNNGGWQWSAGTGADAAPYFRIQNPWTQTKSYDPKADYIKRWLPELRDIAPEKLMRPPKERLSRNYPLPIVDHAEARQKTLELYSAAQGL
ncbi:MAG: deoxyribodipyrimidine photo-lyase [Chthoniobacterales bacterium]